MDLIDVLNVLWRSKWIILTVTILVTAAIAYRSFSAEEQYQSEAILVVGNLTPASGNPAINEATVASYAELVNTPQVYDLARSDSSLDQESRQAVGAVFPSTLDDSPYLRLTGTGGDPLAVQSAVNAVALALVERVSEIQEQIIEEQRNNILDESALVENELNAEQVSPEMDQARINALEDYRQALIQQNEELALQVSQGSNLTVISDANTSSRVPNSPLRNTFLGLVIGLVSGIVVGFIYDSIRSAITGGKDARTMPPFFRYDS